ncbi:MAG: hypothetical protein C4523_03800 [Myxococcales bacterium]|nr:MAG: hypothetical protein C4523_03800 [Myxococcales bacterium]
MGVFLESPSLRQLLFALMAAMSMGSGSTGLAAELTPLPQSLEDAGFQLISDDRNVKVYDKNSQTEIRLAAESHFEFPPARVLRVILDYEGQVGAIKRISESRVLKCGDNWLLVYQRLNLPFVNDRDYTLFVKWGTNADTSWVIYKAVTNLGPKEKAEVVRVKHNEGSWQLTPDASGKGTVARYQMTIDMGGWIPQWLVRPNTIKEMPAVFDDIRSLFSLEKKGESRCLSKL